MDRAEKRRLERERQKLNGLNIKEDEANRKWYSQLPVNRKIFIGKFIESQTIKNDNFVASIMDKCFMGAIDDNFSVDVGLMKKVVNDSNNYILDYKEYLDKYGDGGFDMIDNLQIREDVKAKMLKDMEAMVTKVKSMAALKKEYKLPAAELSDLWIECKQERLDFCNTKPIQCVDVETIKKTLKVISEVKVIEGQFGFYHISSDGLRFSSDRELLNHDVAYCSKDDVITTRDNLTKEYLDRVESINKQIKELNNELGLSNKSYETMNNQFDELEQVFDM